MAQTIDEAIKVNEEEAEEEEKLGNPLGAEAIRLGKEALKRLQAYREGIDIPFDKLLPGETKD